MNIFKLKFEPIELEMDSFGTIKFEDITQTFTTAKCDTILKGHTESVTCVSRYKNNKLLTGSFDESIRIWDFKNKTSVEIPKADYRYVRCVKFLKNGQVISGGYDSQIKIWDMHHKQCISVLTGHTENIMCLFELENGQILSCSQDKSIRVWDITSQT